MIAAVPNMTTTLPNIAATVRIIFRFITLLFLGKGGVQGVAMPFKKVLGLPPLQNGYYGCTNGWYGAKKAENGW
jgi:hypothetical protein